MKLMMFLICFLYSCMSLAVDIASCKNPMGKAYYSELGFMEKKNSGWVENEKISGGITKLKKSENGKFDILFVDSSNQIISARDSGAKVTILNRGKNIVSFIVVYPRTTTEIYTFIKNKSGVLEYTHLLNRAGDAAIFPKSSLMRGDCDYIEFSKL